MEWFLGFKLHLIINDKGEIMLCSYYVHAMFMIQGKGRATIMYCPEKSLQ